MGGRKLCCRLVTDYDGGIIGTITDGRAEMDLSR